MSSNHYSSPAVLAPFKIPNFTSSSNSSDHRDPKHRPEAQHKKHQDISGNHRDPKQRPEAQHKKHQEISGNHRDPKQRPKAQYKKHQVSSTVSNSSSLSSRMMSSPTPTNLVPSQEEASLFNMDIDSIGPSSTPMPSSGQPDSQMHSSGQPYSQVHSSGQEERETHLPDRNERQTQTLSELANSVHKAMSAMSHTNCADEVNRKFIEEIMEHVEEMAKNNRHRDEGTKAQLDALGTRLWNSALIIRAAAGDCPQQEILSAIAMLRRTACLLLNMCRLEKEDVESSQKIVTVCARTAMDLINSDERVMAEEMIQMAAECAEPLEKIDTDAGVFDDDYKDSVFEAVCAYRLARFQLSAGSNEAVMSHFMHKALNSCQKLRSDSWVSRATLKYAIELAVKVLENEEDKANDVLKDASKLQEIKIFLERVHMIFRKKPYADCPAYIRSRLDVAFLLSRVQYITGKLNSKDENKLAAEDTLRLAVNEAKEAFQTGEATKASLLIMSMMEERKAPLELMLQGWRDLVSDLDFEGAHIDTIIKILFRTLLRKPNNCSGYILRVVSDICQCMLDSRLDKVSCATHIGKLGFVAVKAAGLDCTAQLKEFFDVIDQSNPPVQLSEEMGYAWLDALLKAAKDDNTNDHKKAIDLLALASHPILAKPEDTAYVAVKKAAYLLLQAGRYAECDKLILQQLPSGDPPASLILCISFIRQRKELHAGKLLDSFEPREWSANVLLWIVSEAFAQGMTSLQSRAMVMFLEICPDTDHDLNNIRLLRTVVAMYIDLLQRTSDPEEQELTFDKLSKLIGRYETILLAASHADKQSKEKAQEADWIIGTLYKLAIDSENKLHPHMIDSLDRTIVQIADYREAFEEPCQPQIHLLRFYAGFRSLLEFKKLISTARETAETVQSLQEAWKRVTKCERDLFHSIAAGQYNEARENDKLAVLSIKVEILLELQKDQDVKSILESEEVSLDHRATDEVARVLVQHPRTEPFLLKAAVKKLINFYKDQARTHGSYPANEVAEWLRHLLEKQLKHYKRMQTMVYHEIIELLGDMMLPLLGDDGLVANPPWPTVELIYFQQKAREVAYDLAKQGKVEPAFQLINVSNDILQGIKPDLTPEAAHAEERRLQQIVELLERRQGQTFYHPAPNVRNTSFVPPVSNNYNGMFH
ncbi:uncharacterized protein FA14DRAFT_179931 [Meira miltonrushii]|uniref:Uncharacterized protein n=1 Tax=Meira miltonrushii TaxID=1280837 RepID=A0A316V6R0_9BASI|nr:uncharacterized protein FA14DRAFT_179931 [Meira miltonrushii]PWN33277.1 hypothetical protein FA14DRAFT_179931 [Meira miltonrushii]